MEKIASPRDVIHVEGEIPVEFLYTPGIGYEKFLLGLKEGKIVGGTCKCGTVIPARAFCEDCFTRIEEFVEVENRGYVYTFTRSHYDMDGRKLDKPRILVFVVFENTFGGIVHRFEGENVEIGKEVAAQFEKERKGSILDIRCFKAK